MNTLARPHLLQRAAPALAVMLAVWGGSAAAQDLPQWQHTSINDFAGLLTQDDTRTLDQALIALHDETGVEGTVVTLTDRARYGGSDGLEAFATRLFNAWGVGDRSRNDGFMVLVLPDDHEARIELGRGYPASADIRAQDVMTRIMVPAFRDDAYSRGLRDGTLAVIDHIARPVAAGEPVQTPSGLGDGIGPFALFAAFAAGLIGLSRWQKRRRNRCRQCGHQGLTRIPGKPVRKQRKDGGWMTSNRSDTLRCPACGWERSALAALPVISYYDRNGDLERTEKPSLHESSSGFGGGSSSGGGASGRW